MAEEQQLHPALTPVVRPLSLIPVGLKEAALDSPSFRASVVHFAEQIDVVEKWLENYVKSASKLASEATLLEGLVNSFLSSSAPPQQVSEAVIDHDYTLLAIKRYGEGAKEFWTQMLKGVKRMDGTVVEPIRSFLDKDLRNLKEARKSLEQSQKNFDTVISKHAGQSKSKEASSLREDAFQLHEARKAYLKASMDFCVLAPQIRATLDRLLVKVFTDRWREMKDYKETSSSGFARWSSEMERIRGWSREMENGERLFKRELQLARKQIEDSAEYSTRPSRELDDYATSTVPFLGSQAPSIANLQSPAKPTPEKSEKQGWLFQRTTTGKPARTVWVRKWFYVKNGIFGWLVQGNRSGAVEESEKIGVLLCGVRPAFQEERRFCFEVKTKDTTLLLQAETQSELLEWMAIFDVAKRKALEDPASTDLPAAPGTNTVDAAFAINPPVAPEFAAKADNVSGEDPGGSGLLAERGSFDISRRSTMMNEEGERARDHAARIIQKLDLHRKSTASPQLSQSPIPSPVAPTGIAGLISASHAVLPVPGAPQPSPSLDPTKTSNSSSAPTSTLAPSTLANPPAPTNLSKTAVAVSGDRGIGISQSDGGIPSGLMANLWGSTNWGYVNRLERGEMRTERRSVSQPQSPVIRPYPEGSAGAIDTPQDIPLLPGPQSPTPISHRKTISMGTDLSRFQRPFVVAEGYPNYYPLALKAQDAQFHMLFPNAPREEKVVLVFRATWNPNEQQEFPGRVYVTTNEIHFYSNHIGLVLITGIALDAITEVTAAPGRDCDFLYLHFKEGARPDGATRITIKTFLEPLRLLQRRLDFLVQNCHSDSPLAIEDVLKTLIKLEADDKDSPSDSWEDSSTPVDRAYRRREQDIRANLRIDGELYRDPAITAASKNATKFKLPPHPVVYAPQGMTKIAVERDFKISAKALFHVMFGDKSALFQTLYCRDPVERLIQSPWVQPEQGHHRRDFQYEVRLAGSLVQVTDYQVIEVFNDHLCYEVMDRKTPWYLPHSSNFTLVSRLVITHTSKSHCKLAVYTKVDWSKAPLLGKSLIERQALRDLDLYALDLAETVTEQVNRMGSSNSTRKAIQIFGSIGQQTQAAQVSASDIPPPSKPRRFQFKRRTMANLATDALLSSLNTALSTLLSWLTAIISAILKVCTAHTLLLTLLILSAGTNFFFSSRDTWTWWRERNAANFMARVGVTPNAIMSKAVYLRDLDDFILHNATQAALTSAHIAGVTSGQNQQLGSSNKCRQTFTALLHATDPDATAASAATTAYADTPTRYTAARLSRTRQHLAAYRHDLLVAMRLVNSVERETLRAEWENWVLDEGARCRRLRGLLKQDDVGEGEGGEVEREIEVYCEDCLGELGALGGGLGG